MIESFADKVTEAVFHGTPIKLVRRFPQDPLPAALRKLDLLNAARHMRDLRTPPGNRLEPLAGDLKGLHSIRVNDQWRVVFRWEDSNAHDVRLVDYH
nr:putative integron gene cassette protein [uncultured bacterium]